LAIGFTKYLIGWRSALGTNPSTNSIAFARNGAVLVAAATAGSLKYPNKASYAQGNARYEAVRRDFAFPFFE
jgi:hypothetical protein